MKVKRLRMKSFRGISDLILEFETAEPIVFIGINGVGKSSILDGLAILLSWLIARIQSDPDSKGSFMTRQGGRLVSGRQQDLANGRSFSEHDLNNASNETYSEIAISYQEQEVTWALSMLQTRLNMETSTDLVELEPLANDIRCQWNANSDANIPLAVYYPVNRAVLDIPLELPEEHSFKQIDAYNQALTGVQIGFGNFFQWFRALEDVENEERRDSPEYRNPQLEAVRKAIYSLLGKEDFSNLRVRRSPLRMTVTKQGQELIINQLSDGEKCLLALAGDLARRLAIANPGLAEPLQGNGVVLIDEVELHLHPAWQRKVIPTLRDTFPNCQFIVTTHSPQVISNVKPSGIYVLEATPESVVVKHPDSSYGRDTNRILEDLMAVPERPQEVKERLIQLSQLIDAGELNTARQLHQQLVDEIGANEPELVKAGASIRRKEILIR